MKKFSFLTVSALLVAGLLPLSAVAGDFDGSEPLVCASVHATECGAASQECVTGAPWKVNFPVFVELDFKAKTATTLEQFDNTRVSKMDSINHLDGDRMSIQGIDGEYAWSMLVSEETGSMTLSIAGERGGFLIFGACTTR